VPPLQIFVNYRRDSDLMRASLVDLQVRYALERLRPGAVTVFRDDGIRVGRTWPDEIRNQLAAADIVLAIIGPDWLAAPDQFGRRRIDQSDDWVRQELEFALQNDKVIVPIVFGTKLPPREALPETLARLVDRQAAFVAEETLQRDLEPVHLEVQRILDSVDTAPTASAHIGQLPYPQPPMKLPPTPIPEPALEQLLIEDLPAWKIVAGPAYARPDGTAVELRREFTFRSFKDAIRFMAEVADFAEEANHHPRWENIFRTLIVHLTTWDINHRVSVLDVMLASYFDRKYYAYTNAASS
jgi:pterin-4a-carbinolamine dehydratase